MTHPFTGEPIEWPLDEGLTVAESSAIRDFFLERGVQGPEPEHEGYAFYLSRDEWVRFRGGSLDIEKSGAIPVTGFAVEIVARQPSNEILDVVLTVARKGNLAFLSSTGDSVGLAADSQDPRISARWPNARIIDSIDKLRSWLEQTIGGRKVNALRRR